ncbi:hypothetical protein JTB14_021222 [Gonioctena quinquepunctata]|nr:hypothetical protein JTB14_021222 [Gonioctena quinquepunctata]
MSRGKKIADMCISEKCTHTEPNQEFKVTVVDKLSHQILETGEPGDDSSESDIEEKTHFNEPIQVADNFTGECSYRDLGSDVEEKTDYEGSSDDFVPCSDSDSDTSFNSSSDGENKTKRKKILPKLKSNRHITAEGTAEKQVETYRNGEANLENEKNAIVPVNKRRGRKKTKKGEETRKLKKYPKNWDKNIRKRLKAQGKEYLTIKGKKNLGKELKEACSCRQKCFEKFLEVERLEMFRDFYNLS